MAARDPWGFRPLVMGRLDGATVFCSETCALDLIDAEFVREIEPGELVVADRDGVRSFKPFPPEPVSQCIFEQVYFARPDSTVFGRNVLDSRLMLGRQLARESPAAADIVVPVPDSGMGAALGYSQESGLPFEWGLIRNHYVGRTFIEPRQAIRSFGVKIKLNPVRQRPRGQAGGPHRRLDRARHHLAEDRGHGARGGRARGPHAHLQPAHHGPLLLRHRHPPQERAHRELALGGGDPAVHRRRQPGLPVPRGAPEGGRATPKGERHCTACFSSSYPVAVSQADESQLRLFEKARA